jgi:hypothetical protein
MGNKIFINIVKMLLLNNRNILNITEEDYNILLNSEIDYELLSNRLIYIVTLGKYMAIFHKEQKEILDELSLYSSNNNMIDIEAEYIKVELDKRIISICIEFMIILDTKGGHYMIKKSEIIRSTVDILAVDINRMLLKYNNESLSRISEKIISILSILCNIDTIDVDYTTYKFAWESMSEICNI